MNGIVNLIKPPGYTSHDIVNMVRKKLKIKKVGHTGTLDPAAVGVLPLCIGKATKISEFIIAKKKEYLFELTLGRTTDTLDSQGSFLGDVTVTRENIEQLYYVYPKFTGKYQQVPPMYSAIKKDGKKLYELARKGEKVERKSREVEVYNLELVDEFLHRNRKRFLFKVSCQKGTYVRSLAGDLAKAAGTLGYMSFLLRTCSGPFKLDDAVLLEDFLGAETEEIKKNLISMDKALLEFSGVTLEANKDKFFNSGNFVTAGVKKDEFYRVYSEDGKFLGLGKGLENGKLKPEKVLS